MGATPKSSLSPSSTSSSVLPDFPNFDPGLIDQPGGVETNDAIQEWWTNAKTQILALQNTNQQGIQKAFAQSQASTGTLQAEIDAEQIARADGDEALATDITIVSATLSTDISMVSAAVTTEATARATADGFLEGKYTLTVQAGNVVTGMNITSSTGSGTDISSVTFVAADFLIYNSITGLQMFEVNGTGVQLGGVVFVDTSGQKLYIGAGNYNNSDTAFYVDSAGNFSLKDHLSFNGSLLSVSGAINLTSTASPSGSGLFIGSDFLGYYTSGAWKTYMDSSGNFYLGGTGGALLWDEAGGNLLIQGNAVFSGTLDVGSGLSRTRIDTTLLTYGYGQTERIELSNNGTSAQLNLFSSSNAVVQLGGLSGAGFINVSQSGGSIVSSLDSNSLQIGNNTIVDTAGHLFAPGALSAGGDTDLGGNLTLTGTAKNIMLADGVLMKVTPGGWGPYLWDGANLIELNYDGVNVNARINGGTVIVLG